MVFSTYVEVILAERREKPRGGCVLHVCGGDPGTQRIKELKKQCSPRMWR